MNKREYNKWVKKLRKYWKMREKEEKTFDLKEEQIEKLMREETGEELEFFYGDFGECCGIGHSDWKRHQRRKKNYFPLIHDVDLERRR